MGAFLDRFRDAGITLSALSGGRVHATGPLTDELRAVIRAHKPALLAELEAANESTHFRWRVAIPGRDPFEVHVVPEATVTEMQTQYPGASLEPLPDMPSRTETAAEADELRSLIGAVLAEATPEDRDEALHVACADDPEAALVSFRGLVTQQPP